MCKQDIDSFHQVRALGDDQLIAQLKDVLSRQRCLTAELVCHLSEVEVRGIHLRLGYGSLHEYCVSALQMSDDEAYVRIRAARLSRDYPAVLVMLAKGEIHLSALKLLASLMRECVDRSRRERRALRLVPEPVNRMAPGVFRTRGQ